MTRRTMEALVRRRLLMTFALFLGVLVSPPLHAKDHISALPSPTGHVVLTVTGNIQITNSYGQADFDLAMLQAMPISRIVTSTPWTEGVATFDGVAVETLMRRLAAIGETGEFTALNDYAVRIELKDAADKNAIIAYRMNGETMSIRGKGPLWVMYPMDDNPDLQTSAYRDRMIWQLRSIDIF